jgi:hypothetical protein
MRTVRWSLVLIFSLLVTTCDLFMPRDPEPPGGDVTPYTFKPPTSPEIVLENIAIALPAFQPDHLLNVLVAPNTTDENFVFIPDPATAEASGGLFNSWGYPEEQSFLNSLIQRLAENGLQDILWDEIQVTSIEDQTEVQANYSIQLTYTEQRGALPEQLAGETFLTLIRGDDQLYRVLVWQDEDITSDSLPCWSDLKAAL